MFQGRVAFDSLLFTSEETDFEDSSNSPILETVLMLIYVYNLLGEHMVVHNRLAGDALKRIISGFMSLRFDT